jgi:Family of unknown function (DUF5677)
MPRRLDIAATINSVELTEETWEWLDLLGEAMALVQRHALAQDADEEWFQLLDHPLDYKAILITMLHRDASTLGSIIMCVRCEWTHQAAALVRMLCESLITLRYVAQDKVNRSKLFWGYGAIEEYKGTESILKWDAERARPEHVTAMEAFRDEIRPEYEAALPTYTFAGAPHPCSACGFQRKGKKRTFRNWCNKRVSEMAAETGSERLYGLVYTHTSPYIHTSAWSLRAVGALSRRGYNPERALIDTSMLVRVTLSVWVEWAAFCDREVGWNLCDAVPALIGRLDELQQKLDAKHAAKKVDATS